MFVKLYAVLAVLIETLIVLFGDIVESWNDFWIPIVLFFGLLIGLFVFHIIMLLVISLFINKNKPCEKPVRFFKFMVDYTVEAVLNVARVKTVTSGLEKIPTDRRFLLVSNHRSGFDPLPVIVKLRSFGLLFVSKPENFKIPIAGAFTHKCCYLPIDRENPRKAMRTIHKATDFVIEDIASVAIYPEGTRSKSGELIEFKDGVFYIAKKSKCPIVVMTVQNTENIIKNFPFKRTKIHMDILDVLEPDCFSDKTTHEISEQVRGIMLEKLGK